MSIDPEFPNLRSVEGKAEFDQYTQASGFLTLGTEARQDLLEELISIPMFQGQWGHCHSI